MYLQTVAHATLLISAERDGRPLLATDPWLLGSCYWRSWWLANPPNESTIDRVGSSRYIYITHEHPDHFHVPSLRRIGTGPKILLPDFLDMQMDRFLRDDLGFEVHRLKPNEWTDLAPGVQVLSLPYPSNDSVLLVNTPTALVINLNDVKPERIFLDRLGETTRKVDKPRVVLRSYSLAGPSNSYFVDGDRRTSPTPRNFVQAAFRHARAVGGDYFAPFASQAVFRREDSRWANDVKVDYALLEKFWKPGPKLLPPYVTLDLETFDFVSADPPDLPEPQDPAKQRDLIADAHLRDDTEALLPEDIEKLERILDEERVALLILFPRGLAFAIGDRRLVYRPRPGTLRESDDWTGATVELPLAPFRDAVTYGHFTDLFIGLFVRIHLESEEERGRFDTLYKVLFLRDYGYGGLAKRLRWAIWAWRTLRPRVPLPASG